MFGEARRVPQQDVAEPAAEDDASDHIEQKIIEFSAGKGATAPGQKRLVATRRLTYCQPARRPTA